jgi:DNA-binding response OmpR family regulator
MKKVMVVEDDKAVLDLLGIVLSDAGYQTILLPRSEDIPQKVAAEKPDLVLLDILIEPKHGMEVLAALTEEESHPPVILISAAVKGVREMGQIARALGCYDFIEKPFDVTDLLARVKSALTRKTVAA